MGFWQIYCALCGAPCNIDNAGFAEFHEWMNYVRVLYPDENHVSDIGTYDMYGDIIIDENEEISLVSSTHSHPSPGAEDWKNELNIDLKKLSGLDNHPIKFYVVHNSCWLVTGKPLLFNTSAPNDLLKYQGQYLELEEFVENDKDQWKLLDPLKNKFNKERIISKTKITKYYIKNKEPNPDKALISASATGRYKVVKKILTKYPQIDPGKENYRALYQSIWYGHESIALLFIFNPKIRHPTVPDLQLLRVIFKYLRRYGIQYKPYFSDTYYKIYQDTKTKIEKFYNNLHTPK